MSKPVLSLDLTGVALGGAPVLGPISLTVHAGETLAITGPSGVGKSTLLRVIAGLETGFDGQCHAPGRCAFVFQEPTLLPWRSLADNLCLTTGIARDAALGALAEVGLEGLQDRFPGETSLGQQRRLSLARAFAHQPDLLLLDEPFVSLDPALAEEMLTLFETLQARTQVATIVVTHVAYEAERLASKILRLAGRPAVFVNT